MAPARSINDNLAMGLAIVITTAWAISFMVDILVKTYDPPPSVHILMVGVAGSVFGEGLIRKRSPAKEDLDV
jgi:hypothetical protein